jgi:hypothetical protein
MEETSTGQGYLEANYWSGQILMWAVAQLNNNNNNNNNNNIKLSVSQYILFLLALKSPTKIFVCSGLIEHVLNIQRVIVCREAISPLLFSNGPFIFKTISQQRPLPLCTIPCLLTKSAFLICYIRKSRFRSDN